VTDPSTAWAFTSKAVIIIQSVPAVAFGVVSVVGIEFCGTLALIHGIQNLEDNILVLGTKELHAWPDLCSDSLLMRGTPASSSSSESIILLLLLLSILWLSSL
jgi:hypothetical protein